MMPHLPMGARENGVGVGDRSHLKFGIRGERLRSEDLVSLRLLLGVFLPFDVSAGLLADAANANCTSGWH